MGQVLRKEKVLQVQDNLRSVVGIAAESSFRGFDKESGEHIHWVKVCVCYDQDPNILEDLAITLTDILTQKVRLPLCFFFFVFFFF